MKSRGCYIELDQSHWKDTWYNYFDTTNWVWLFIVGPKQSPQLPELCRIAWNDK